MSTQKLFAVLFSAFLLSLALVSAAVSYTSTLNPTVLTSSANSTVVTITNTGAENLTITVPTYITGTITGGTANAPITGTLTSPLQAGNTTTSTLAITGFSAFKLGSYSANIIVANASNSSDNSIIPVTFIKSFCSAGTIGNGTTRYLEIVSVKDSSSDDDFDWKPADTVTIAVKVDYTNTAEDDDEIDAVIKLELYDSNNNLVEFDDEDSLEREINLEESSSTEEFILDIPIEGIDDGDYKLYVKVYEDTKESTLCMQNVSA